MEALSPPPGYYSVTSSFGIFCTILPCSNLPLAFALLFTPSCPQVPHCLKKKGIPLASACLLMSRTQVSAIGRALGPLSPPTIIQLIPVKSRSPSSPKSGSIDRNLLGVGTSLRQSIRCLTSAFSTVTPTHKLLGTARSVVNNQVPIDATISLSLRSKYKLSILKKIISVQHLP